MSSRVVGDQRKSMDARLRALHTAAPSPELATAALRLIEDVTTTRGRFLTELPIGKLGALWGADHLSALLKLYAKIRNTRDTGRGKPTKRIADQVGMRLLLDEVAGQDIEAPNLFSYEIGCTACQWPAATRCRRCQRAGCGLERCMPELLEAVELPYRVCDHRGSNGDLCVAIHNDAGPSAVGTPMPCRPGPPITPHADWQAVGELGVDAGLGGIVPLGGGSVIKVFTPKGDGAFPIEVRICADGNLQARVTFARTSSRQRSRAVATADSYSGFFAICDPLVSHPGCYALVPGEHDQVWLADFGLLVRAARVAVTGIRQGRGYAQLTCDFFPTVKSVPATGW